MDIIHCYSQNIEFSNKLCSLLDLSDIKVFHQTSQFKFEKCKYVSLILIESLLSLNQWDDYYTKLNAEKKTTILKYVLPISNLGSSVSELNTSGVFFLRSEIVNIEEVKCLRLLVRQKIMNLNSNIDFLVNKSNKFIFSIISKMNWKDQVVLTSEEIKSFMDMHAFDKNVLHLGDSLTLLKIDEFTKKNVKTDGSIFLKIAKELYRLPKEDLSEEKIRKIILFLIIYEKRTKQNVQIYYVDFMILFFEQVFQSAPFPIAIELDGRDLIWQNKYFSNLKLFPKMFKKIDTEGKIHTKHGFFKVYKNQFTIEDQLFQLVYLAQQSEEITNTGEDLGIITSSLAHEMNNPLAAIKAAIELILIMETNLKSKETLDQMLVSVNRCLQLVKIFLGFTKVSFNSDKLLEGQSKNTDIIPFYECWDYALQLMRTRLISSSLRIQTEWSRTNYFKISNSNIVTMMIYWLLNQIVSIFERKILISRNTSSDQKVKITEDINEVLIKLDTSVKDLSDQLEQSLLMKHLLELENLKLLFESDQFIVLKRNDYK